MSFRSDAAEAAYEATEAVRAALALHAPRGVSLRSLARQAKLPVLLTERTLASLRKAGEVSFRPNKGWRLRAHRPRRSTATPRYPSPGGPKGKTLAVLTAAESQGEIYLHRDEIAELGEVRGPALTRALRELAASGFVERFGESVYRILVREH
jgi:DNA-binding IclR family transcriptional regulator